jgi:hypothetical protein
LVVSDYTSDIPSPLTDLSDSDDDEETFDTKDFPYNQEFVINTRFNPYLEENRNFPCGRSEEERLDFTKKSRERVEEHASTPSTLEELSSLVLFNSFLDSVYCY